MLTTQWNKYSETELTTNVLKWLDTDQTGKLKYDPQPHFVGVKLDDSRVNILKLSSHWSLCFEEMATLKQHEFRINLIEFDFNRGYVYTAAEDYKFIVTDLRYTEKVLNISDWAQC